MGITADEMPRATTRTIGAEILGLRHDLLEHQLANFVRNPPGRAYGRASLLDELKDMTQAWVNFLHTIKAKATSASWRGPRFTDAGCNPTASAGKKWYPMGGQRTPWDSRIGTQNFLSAASDRIALASRLAVTSKQQ